MTSSSDRPPTGGRLTDSTQAGTAGAADTPHVLREYALLADGERGALVGPRGDIAWMCAPAWHDDSVFTALLGGRGTYAVRPTGPFVWGGYYEAGTLIWRSRWVTHMGIVECREALAFPGSPDRLVLMRRILAVDGDSSVQVVLDPRAHFGQSPMTDTAQDSGVWTARTADLHVRWSGAAAARRDDDGGLSMVADLRQGEHHDLVLEIGKHAHTDAPPRPDLCWADTEMAWHQAVPEFPDSLAPRDTRHAYTVLRGLTGSTGGMVAAATMSLPEHADAGRNYDYRYVWIRDQSMAGQAAATAGAYPLLDTAVRFVSERLLEHGPKLAPAYTVSGTGVPDQHSVDLPGYPGGHNIVGNHVNQQFQLDTFGEALLLLAAAAGRERLDENGWRAAELAAHAIETRWDEPEAGIWELDDDRWTESRLICVAGLRAMAAVGAGRGKAEHWNSVAGRLLADTDAHATHPSGRWQRSQTDTSVDAALLLPPLRGAPAPDDPHTIATLRAVDAELGDDHYLYRFRHDRGDLARDEGAFLLCGFAMAMSMHQQGNHIEAVRWFDRNRSACGPPALFSEEFDVIERQLRGNLPQAFVHALLLDSSVRLAEPPQASVHEQEKS